MTAVEWFVKGLRERGVEWIATLCGHGLDPLFYAAKSAGLRLIDTRNEQAAAYLAEAYGRLTRAPGVVAVSSGVAHANAMSGVLNAHFDQGPLLLISGAGAHRTAGMGHFQDVDQVALAAPVTKYSRVIDRPERTLEILGQAWESARSLPPGPVHLTFPTDIQQAEVSAEQMIRPATPAGSACGAPRAVESAAELVSAARRPLIVAGSGVYYARESEALLAFCEEFAVPVVVPIWDRGSIDRPTRSFMGVIGAASGGPRLLADADLILMAGAAADYRVGFLQPAALSAGSQVVPIAGGWRQLTEAYRQRGGQAHQSWLTEATQRRDEFRQSLHQKALSQARQGLHALHILDALRPLLAEDTILLIDGGSIGQWVHQLLCDRYPGHWLTCGRSGVVGWGLPGAMAARLAYPDRPVILISGDGAFTFTVAEIESAVRQRLPFVAIVADDQAWGITKSGHIQTYGEAVSSTLGPIEFAKLAEACGARGVRVSNEKQISQALAAALSEPAVTVIHVPIVGGNP